MDADDRFLAAVVAGTQSACALPAPRRAALARLADAHGVAPLLFWRLKQEGITGPELEELARIAHEAALEWALLEHAQRQVDVALQQAGIPAIWLKGSALAWTVYPDPALRWMRDLDVLVPLDVHRHALRVVRQLGFHYYTRTPWQHPLREDDDPLRFNPQTHHYQLKGGLADKVILELHFQLLDSRLSPEHLGWFWSQTQSIRLPDGQTLTVLCPEAHLLYLAAHLMLHHGEAWADLRHYLDLHLLLTACPLDWALVLDQAVALRWTGALERALAVTGDLFGTPLPTEILPVLVARRPADEGPTAPPPPPARVSRWQATHQLLARYPWKDRWRLVVEILLPAPSYLRKRYSIPPHRSVWPYYPYRWWDLGYELLGVALGRLTHLPSHMVGGLLIRWHWWRSAR